MKFILQLLGLVTVLAAMAPVAMAGGNMIGAFMAQRKMVYWLCATVLTMLSLVAGALFTVSVVQPWIGLHWSQALEPLAALVMLVPPWWVYLLAKKLSVEKAP
jgi:hypothetical protein